MTEKPPTNAAVGSETAAAVRAPWESPIGKDAPKQMSAMQAYVVSFQPLQRNQYDSHY